MANLRELKKEIDYRLEEVVFDCDMAIAFQPSKEQEIFELMQKAVALRNELIAKVSNPTEPHNKSLVRKYYAALRADIVRSFEALFEELSKINEDKRIFNLCRIGKFCGRRQATVSSRSYHCRSLRGAPGRAACNRGGVFSCIVGLGIESVENR